MKHKELGIKQRITNLKKLITDSTQLKFNSLLVFGYQEQLNLLQEEVSKDKNKRMEWKNGNRDK